MSGTETLLVSALLRVPELLKVVPDLSIDHFRDFRPRLVYQSLRNVEARGELVTIDAVLSEIDAGGYGEALSDGRPNGTRHWLEQQLASVPERFGLADADIDRVEQMAAELSGQRDADAAAVRDAEPDEQPAPDGPVAYLLDSKDRVLRRELNVSILLQHHKDYRGRWSWNEMTEAPFLDGKFVDEHRMSRLRHDIEHRLGFSPSTTWVESAVGMACSANPFHPIRDYLRGLRWDSKPRLRMVSTLFLGSTSDRAAEQVRRFMIGAVARVMKPGCKLDTVLVLSGEEGYRKSTFFKTLGGEWHDDSFIDLTSKDGMMQFHASWLYEFAELENVISGRAASRTKSWVTSATDTYRPPYKPHVIRKPRGALICGTTNREQILSDDSGWRRWWIIPVFKEIDVRALAAIRDQLWAEAVAEYDAGLPWWFERDEERQSEHENERFAETDPWVDAVREAVELRRQVTVPDLLGTTLKVGTDRQGRWDEMRVSRILKSLGWKREKVKGVWTYIKPNVQTVIE